MKYQQDMDLIDKLDQIIQAHGSGGFSNKRHFERCIKGSILLSLTVVWLIRILDGITWLQWYNHTKQASTEQVHGICGGVYAGIH